MSRTDIDYSKFSTPQQIRERFDADVERFSVLEIGQAAAMDSPECMKLIADTAAAMSPDAISVLDVGCGAGNYTLLFLQQLARRNVQTTLLDLSLPMLERAATRVSEQVDLEPRTLQGDLRELDLGMQQYDVILASAVLHHLRDDQQWQDTFAKLFESLKPGGWLWVYDLVEHDDPQVHAIMKQEYAKYLEAMGGPEYRQKVFAYVAEEDTPRSLDFQTRCMTAAGFGRVLVLHLHALFAAYGARRPAVTT